MLIWCYRAHGNPRQFYQVEFILLLDLPRPSFLKTVYNFLHKYTQKI